MTLCSLWTYRLLTVRANDENIKLKREDSEINNRLELSEASAALVAIPRGNSTANFDIKKTLFARSSRHSSAFAVLGKTHTVLTVIFPVM